MGTKGRDKNQGNEETSSRRQETPHRRKASRVQRRLMNGNSGKTALCWTWWTTGLNYSDSRDLRAHVNA